MTPINSITNTKLTEYLSGISLFKELNRADYDLLVQHASLEQFELNSNPTVFEKGQQESDFYYIVSGAVRLHDGGYNFEDLKPGDYFGEYAVLDDAPRSLSATVGEDSMLLAIDKAGMDLVMDRHPSILRKLVASFVKRLRHQNSIENQLVISRNQITQEKAIIESEKAVVEKEKVQVEKHNMRMTESMEYARFVQESILSGKDFRNTGFKFLRAHKNAKDIVSGDFYWFTKVNHLSFVALVDCTGHGAPGALMSIFGHHMLRTVIEEDGLTRPDVILTTMHSMLMDSWNASGHGMSDGMDMGLLVLDNRTNRCLYTGAHLACFVVPDDVNHTMENADASLGHEEYDHVLYEYKGTPFSLGDRNRIPKFKLHEFQVNPGDRLFMLTDGYTDQMNRESGKRIQKRTFKELLINWQHFPIERQLDELADFFQIWKGDAEQIDDATVVAMEI